MCYLFPTPIILLGFFFLLNLSIITTGKSYLAISRGSINVRRRVAEQLLSRIGGAEILCEDPLIIGFRARSRDEARAAMGSLESHVLIIRGGVKLARELCSASSHGSSSIGLLRSLASQLRVGEHGMLSRILRMAPMVAPSIVSTIGRIVNDMNMIIAGSIASGGVLIMSLYGSRRGGSAKIIEGLGLAGSAAVMPRRRATS